MAAPNTHSRALERITRLCASTSADAVALRLAVLAEIRGAVGFDAYAWLLTDPETEVGSAPLADVPCLPELPRLIRLKYLTPINRWTHIETSVALLRESTAGDMERSLVWRDMLSRFGVTDVASLVFRCRYGCWGFLDLWRSGAATAFTDGDAAFLSAVAKPVTEALRRCQASTFRLEAPATARVGPVVLMLSRDLEVQAQTAETNEYLRLLVPPGADGRPIPAGAYNVAAQLLSVEAGVDDHPPTARVHLSAGVWLTLRAAHLGTSPHAEQGIAVTIEASTPVERMTLYGRASGLSARELELFEHLIGGLDTRGIAQQMFLSENTVQDHLKSIFAKTATSNRRTLLARTVGR
jgi:DNA-binding CsgD family transcriptional regulator